MAKYCCMLRATSIVYPMSTGAVIDLIQNHPRNFLLFELVKRENRPVELRLGTRGEMGAIFKQAS